MEMHACSSVYLDAVITLVDAKHIMQHLQPTGPMAFTRHRAEAEKQIALADRVILTKLDLLLASRRDVASSRASVVAAVRALNPTAEILTSSQANVPLQQLLHLRAFSSAMWLRAMTTKEMLHTCTYAHPPVFASRSPAYRLPVGHATSVGCVCLSVEEAVALELLQAWLQSLPLGEIYRLKGLLSIQGRAHRFVLHGVHTHIHGEFDRPWTDDESRASVLVVIGHRLDVARLRSGFFACRSTPLVTGGQV